MLRPPQTLETLPVKYMYVPATVRNTQDGFLSNPAAGWPGYTARYKNEGLGDVPNTARLYVVGHGSLAGTSLNSLSATDLLAALRADQLSPGHVHFHLFSCYSGVKMPGAACCFAEAFAHAIRDHFRDAKVYGYLGAVQFDRQAGRKTVAKNAVFSNLGDTFGEVVHAKTNKVSFSIQRRIIGTNRVVADQAASHVATVSNSAVAFQDVFGDGVETRTRVVVW